MGVVLQHTLSIHHNIFLLLLLRLLLFLILLQDLFRMVTCAIRTLLVITEM